MKRAYGLPESLEGLIEEKLQRYNLSLTNTKKIADAVLFMSDFYIDNPMGATPWNERFTWIAQLAYYFPLNYLRNYAVIQEMKNYFDIQHFSKIFDYGSGLGTSSWCFKNENLKAPIFQFEKEIKLKHYWENTGFHWLANKDALVKEIDRNSLGVFSYSLTEVAETLPLLEKFNYLMILEPSIQSDGRKLMELRQELIQRGYEIAAPCVHQDACPLLTHSKKDWCHDRIHFKKPDWFQKIEYQLPIKNETLTFSYLIAFKKNERSRILKKSEIPAPDTDKKLARITGDLLKEKGKSKQLVCFNSERLFLTWLHKQIEPQEIGRGNLVYIPNNAKTLSNEIRITEETPLSFPNKTDI
jgi:ribosomal protein RSM22 (predicted rRNA methylase)